MDFLEVQKQDCKAENENEDDTDEEGNRLVRLPLLGKNLINRGKRSPNEFKYNGPLLGGN